MPDARAVDGAFANSSASARGDIEVHVAGLRQLFDAMDPSPFRDRDLDPTAAAYIVDWARELPRHQPITLLVHLDRAAGPAAEEALLGDAIRQFFGGRATAARTRLRRLFRVGRISLLIGLACLAAAFATSRIIASLSQQGSIVGLVEEGVLIGGWVAMWRPLEIFLYDWWPILAEARLHDRLAAMPVHIRHAGTTGSDAWQRDWPATGVRASAPRTPASG